MEDLLIRAAAVALLAYAITKQDCPFKACLRLRERFPNVKPLRCPFCAAFWLACVVSLIPATFLLPLAVAGVAVFLLSFFIML